MKDLCEQTETHKTLNILFGPPAAPDKATKMTSRFFAEEGIHIVCGGTTASIAAKYLDKPLRVGLDYVCDDVPPIAHLEGVDLVTDGVLTLDKVLLYAKDYLGDRKLYGEWRFMEDGASLIGRFLFEKANNVNFFVGQAINPAHQSSDFPIPFDKKMNLVKELSDCLMKMGKWVKVCYF